MYVPSITNPVLRKNSCDVGFQPVVMMQATAMMLVVAPLLLSLTLTPVSYVVANPSSYAWPDAQRVKSIDDAVPESAKDGWNQTAPHTNFTYAPIDGAASCADYNTGRSASRSGPAATPPRSATIS
jgi:hypothetical protein